MKAVRPGMKEYEVRRSLNKYFAAGRRAPPTPQSSAPAQTHRASLHKQRRELRDGELLLVDAG